MNLLPNSYNSEYIKKNLSLNNCRPIYLLLSVTLTLEGSVVCHAND